MRYLSTIVLAAVALLFGACSTKFKSPFCPPGEPPRLPPELSGVYRTSIPMEDHSRGGKGWNQDAFVKIAPAQTPSIWVDRISFERLASSVAGGIPTMNFGDICSPDGQNYFLQAQKEDHTYTVAQLVVARRSFSIDFLSFNLDDLDALGVKYHYLPKLTDVNDRKIDLSEAFDPLDVVVDNTGVPPARYLPAARTYLGQKFVKVDEARYHPRNWVAVF